MQSFESTPMTGAGGQRKSTFPQFCEILCDWFGCAVHLGGSLSSLVATIASTCLAPGADKYILKFGEIQFAI